MATPDEAHMVGRLLAPEIAQMLDERQGLEARSALAELMDPEVADLLMELEPKHRAIAFRLLPRDRASDIFTFLLPEQQEELLAQLNTEQLAALLNEMDPDDRADLFEEMPGQLAARLLALMKPEERRQTQVILGYPPQSVGRLMTPDYLTLHPQWTVQQALEHIRRNGRDAETLSTLFVIDDRGRLLDDVRLRQLLLVDPQTPVRELMDEQVVSLRATDDREEAVRAIERYDVPVLPVVDRDDVLVGIVTFDDVADVAEEEVTEDFQKAAAVAPLETGYREATVVSLFKKRAGWLVILVGVNLLSSAVILAYEQTLATAVALAAFIPLLIGSGGNAGSQAATLMVRAIAIGDVRLNQWFRIVSKEMLVGISLGLVMGLASALLGLFRGGWQLGAILGLSMVLIVLVANLIGTVLPFILSRLRLDPAVASSPLIATIADATGLLIYFTIATIILNTFHVPQAVTTPTPDIISPPPVVAPE